MFISQVVQVRMPWIPTYQGPLAVSFEHTVVGTVIPPFWEARSGYLASVNLVIQDDAPCPPHAIQALSEGRQTYTCLCTTGYYVGRIDPDFCNSAQECLPCIDGMDCSWFSGVTNLGIMDVTLLPGYYRTEPESLVVVDCPREAACTGDGTHGVELCAEGHTGIMCQICDESSTNATYAMVDNACRACEGSDVVFVFAALAFLLFGTTAFVLLILKITQNLHHDDASVVTEDGTDGADVRNSKIIIHGISARILLSQINFGVSSQSFVSTQQETGDTSHGNDDDDDSTDSQQNKGALHTTFGATPGKTANESVQQPKMRRVHSQKAVAGFVKQKSENAAANLNIAQTGLVNLIHKKHFSKSTAPDKMTTDQHRLRTMQNAIFNRGIFSAKKDGDGVIDKSAFTDLFNKTFKLPSVTTHQLHESQKAASDLVYSTTKKFFAGNLLGKYKLMVHLFQTMNEISVEFQLTTGFTTIFSKINFTSKLFDVSILPVGCVMEDGYHITLLLATVVPLVMASVIALTYFVKRCRLLASGQGQQSRAMQVLQTNCTYVMILLAFTMYAPVSKTVVQAVDYDSRIFPATGQNYLKADYNIAEDSAVHEGYVVYAGIMISIYVIGIPCGAYALLRKSKEAIIALQTNEFAIYELQVEEKKLEWDMKVLAHDKPLNMAEDFQTKVGTVDDKDVANIAAERLEELKQELLVRFLQREAFLKRNHMLTGISPLYCDYEPEFWYWELAQFGVTLLRIGLASAFEGPTLAFLSLMVNIGWLFSLAYTNPFVDAGNDAVAQLIQVTIVVAVAVGLLSFAGEESQKQDTALTTVLIVFTFAAITFPVGIVLLRLARVFCRDQVLLHE
jgi:hypothetical protein